VAERGDVLGGVGFGGREAVVDGGEAKPLRAVERVGPSRAQVAAVVELVVDEGDVEAASVEELGELQHRRDVALRRVRDHHDVRLPTLPVHRRQRTHDDDCSCYCLLPTCDWWWLADYHYHSNVQG